MWSVHITAENKRDLRPWPVSQTDTRRFEASWTVIGRGARGNTEVYFLLTGPPLAEVPGGILKSTSCSLDRHWPRCQGKYWSLLPSRAILGCRVAGRWHHRKRAPFRPGTPGEDAAISAASATPRRQTTGMQGARGGRVKKNDIGASWWSNLSTCKLQFLESSNIIFFLFQVPPPSPSLSKKTQEENVFERKRKNVIKNYEVIRKSICIKY